MKNRNKKHSQPPVKKDTVTVTKRDMGEQSIIVSELQVRSANRNHVDIGKLQDGLRAAESIAFPNRTLLYTIYDEAMRDGHLHGLIEKRIHPVLNKDLSYVVNNKKVDDMDELIDSNVFRTIITEIILRKFWGVRGLEFLPGHELRVKKIPIRHIKPELGIIALEENGNTGYKIDDYPLNVWVMGDPEDLGILLKCAPYTIYKRGNWGDWAQYIEIFGQPVRVIYYDAHDQQTKIELKQVLDESGSALALMVPKQAQFELKDGKQSNGDGKLQDTFKEALNAELSVLVLSNTETTTNGKTGTGAKSEIHADQQLEITKSDMVDVCNMLNCEQFIAILKSYGYPVQDGGKFVFNKEVDSEEIISQLEIIGKVKGLGLPIDPDHIYEISGVPKPSDFDAQMAAREEQARKLAQDPAEEQEEQDAPPPPKKRPVKKKAPAVDLYDNPSRIRRALSFLQRAFR